MLHHRVIAVAVHDELVAAGLDAQSLEHPVEVIDLAGEVAVDVDLGVARFHLEPHRA